MELESGRNYAIMIGTINWNASLYIGGRNRRVCVVRDDEE